MIYMNGDVILLPRMKSTRRALNKLAMNLRHFSMLFEMIVEIVALFFLGRKCLMISQSKRVVSMFGVIFVFVSKNLTNYSRCCTSQGSVFGSIRPYSED